MPKTAPPPKQVTRFEAALLRILRFFFQQVPAEEALPLIRGVMNRPPCLSAAAVHLVRDTLSKGCVLYLVKAGGWKQDRFLRGGEPKAGRLWQRGSIDELTLSFSKVSLQFLIWLTANRPGELPNFEAADAEPTIADQLLFHLAYEAIREHQDIAAVLRPMPIFADNLLCRLKYPADFVDEKSYDPAGIDAWFTGVGSVVLEALQPNLESRWLESERTKGQTSNWDKLLRQGLAETQILTVFLDAAERANREDLARFPIGVLDQLLGIPDPIPELWIGGLQGNAPPRMAERLEVQRAALSLLAQTERLRRWEQRARHSSFMDEDYAARQFWLSEWERLHGSRSLARADKILRMIEPL
ncbi:MAG: hypothetical protein K8T89_14390 [Planctomycetes bacterium]|nr:hypothetical protein [Planctomycetota bacterium]